jgi:DNA helicase HerA-like ATPase
MILDNKIWLGTSSEGPVFMLPKMANRHGLISGATGTGKTVSLQVLAEAFSSLGVPVFLADIKGDIAGMAKPGELNEKIQKRMRVCGFDSFTPKAFPVVFWDVFGTSGHPVRATVSEMGPLLLGRMLNLNETQMGVLYLVFRIADDEGMLLIDLKDLRAMLAYVGERTSEYTINYGNISKSSIGAIQRAIAILEDQGGNNFFGEPALQINDWLRRDDEKRGFVNILAADKLFLRPNLYSSFMLWMLGELYELLPECGDSDLPRMVFFFDEAHLLFEDCPKALLEQIELTIRLIRSKGVGVFFITQNPTDIPSKVLSQLAARVQHALRAFTPQEIKVVQSVAKTFRENAAFDTEEVILSLGTGEALLSFLQEDGTPSIAQRATILPPQSSIGAISDRLRTTLIDTSELIGKYDQSFDRESAYEILSKKYISQDVAETSILRANIQDTQSQPKSTFSKQSFKVFDPDTGTYVESVVEIPNVAVETKEINVPSQTIYAPQSESLVQQTPPPVLVYNTKTQQYEPQQLAQPERKEKMTRKTKSIGEKMLDNFTRSTASGAGYTVGRTISRGILGVFGIK